MLPPSVPPGPGLDFAAALAAARQGSRAALGRLLEDCRHYLLLVSNREVGTDLAGKLAPSDVVQETLLEAQRDFGRFQGNTSDEWRGWLRRILLNNVANTIRGFRDTAKRDLAREVPLEEVPDDELLRATSDGPTPSGAAAAEEEARRVWQALDLLPPDHREVIRLRHQEALSFEEIAGRLGRSEAAVRKLWSRAVRRLRELTGGSPNDVSA